MKNINKITTVIVVSAAILVAVVVSVLLELLASTIGQIAILYTQDWFSHGIPLVTGIAFFTWLQFSKKKQVFLQDVIREVGKVFWPSRKVVTVMTVVCCIMLLVSGVFLGVFDVLFGHIASFLV